MSAPNVNQLISGEIGKGTDTKGATDALNTWVTGATQSAMPSFYQALQGIRESAVRRGISTGDLGTSNEGDLASAFQRNIAGATAQQATSLYESGRNNYLDLLTGQRDYETDQANARRRRRGGVGNAIGGAIGGIGGFLIGGPAGAALGAKAGGSIGAAVGGY